MVCHELVKVASRSYGVSLSLGAKNTIIVTKCGILFLCYLSKRKRAASSWIFQPEMIVATAYFHRYTEFFSHVQEYRSYPLSQKAPSILRL